MWIYKYYFLPSVRFLLTVHSLTTTSLKSLDTDCDRYLKRWGSLPKGATILVIHLSHALSIPQVEDLYHLCHTLELTNVRLVADSRVNNAVDSELLHESTAATTTNAQVVFKAALAVVPASVLPSSSSSRNELTCRVVAKKKVKNILQDNVDQRDIKNVGRSYSYFCGHTAGPRMGVSYI